MKKIVSNLFLLLGILFSLILTLIILNAERSVDFAESEDDIKTCYLGGGNSTFKCINGVVYSWWNGGVEVILNQEGRHVECSCQK